MSPRTCFCCAGSGTAATRAPRHLRPLPSSGLRDCVHTRRTTHRRPSSWWVGGRDYAGWAGTGAPTCGSAGSAPPTRPSPDSSFKSWGFGGRGLNGTLGECGLSCAILAGLGRGGRGCSRAVPVGDAAGQSGTEPVARRAYTCAGTCVWCLEVGVRVSRGHECAYVCVWRGACITGISGV